MVSPPGAWPQRYRESWVVVSIEGDYNLDGQVNLADYTLWRDTLGKSGTGLAAVGNGDTVVDTADYGVWKRNFGQASSTSGTLVQQVPEPASLLILLPAALLACFRFFQGCQ